MAVFVHMVVFARVLVCVHVGVYVHPYTYIYLHIYIYISKGGDVHYQGRQHDVGAAKFRDVTPLSEAVGYGAVDALLIMHA